MKKHRQVRKLVIEKETVARLGSRMLSNEALHEAVGGSVRLSCDGLRCSNDSACNAGDPVPLCE
jgi:hypothetical protein